MRPTCKTCARWERKVLEMHRLVHPAIPMEDWLAGKNPPRDGGIDFVTRKYSAYGECMLAEPFAWPFQKPTPTAPMIYSDDDGGCSMHTRADFGCIRHEATA